jgi:hypothetical protein
MALQPIQWAPPALDCDKDFNTRVVGSVKGRCRLERRVVWNLLVNLAAAGWIPVRVNNGDEDCVISTAATTHEKCVEAMERVFEVDESRVFFRHATEPPEMWAFVVLGNDGYDAISDYTLGGTFEAVLNEFSDNVEGLL